ncbi:MAG: ribonuclease HII [bacterium]|nr:ribonuclease HII [bacterium]
MLIAGVDEVGRGPLAGPVVAAVAVFEKGYINSEIKDSKKLSAKQRELLVEVIKRDAIAWSIVAVGHTRILKLNIREASRLAMALAVRRIDADLILVDGNVEIETHLPQRTVIGGDDLHVEISAASILAKVWRDNLMQVLDKKYPGYGFSKHVGYATKLHRRAVRKLGPCKIHREAFSCVKEFVKRKKVRIALGCR